jgi:hypothetical protein
MKTCIVVDIDQDSLRKADMSDRQVLDMTLDTLSRLYNRCGLEFDCGYNPQYISKTGVC